jgi:hypothetical protein
VSTLSATQVDRRKYAAIAAEERREPILRLGHPYVGQYNHTTLRVKPINSRFDHIVLPPFKERQAANQKNG